MAAVGSSLCLHTHTHTHMDIHTHTYIYTHISGYKDGGCWTQPMPPGAGAKGVR